MAAAADDAEGLGDLVDRILSTHHAFLHSELPRLTAAVSDSDVSTELRQVFDELRGELELHLRKEEQILFPLCKELEASDTLPAMHCGSVGNPIRMMQHDHADALDALDCLRILTNDFTTAGDASDDERVLVQGLRGLDADLRAHIRIEDNVLFPAAIARESELASRT